MYRSGHFGPVTFPATIGYEAAGVIDAVGAGVEGFRPGDRVAVLYGLSMERYGTCGEQILYTAERLVKIPDSQSFEEAAASWMQYGTAYMLVEYGGLRAGDSVLITAAASSVGIAAIQIANAVGARPIATTRKADKVQALLDAGASAVINTRETNLVTEVRRLTEGKGANIIFDPIVGPQLGALCEAAAPGANIFLYGLLDSTPVTFPLIPALTKDLTFRVYKLMLITTNPKRMATAKKWILEHLESGALKPVIARVFPFHQMVEAHRYMESNEQIGKIVVTVP